MPSSNQRTSNANQQLVFAGLAAAASISLLLWYYSTSQGSSSSQDALETKKSKSLDWNDDKEDLAKKPPKKTTSSSSSIGKNESSAATTTTPSPSTAAGTNKSTSPENEASPSASASASPMKQAASDDSEKTPLVKNSAAVKQAERDLHAHIEELDKKGKVFFKNKQYLEAAEAFTQALNLIQSSHPAGKPSSSSSLSLQKQAVTLMNNRSAMYEKGDMPELALEDCQSILEMDMNHTKARTRKLRLLEQLKRWHAALVEVCALQLLFMKQNRNNLRMNLPVPAPPVPQSKMEEILNELLPGVMDQYQERWQSEDGQRPLPSAYTILQLLKSYSGYNQWMAAAAKDGSVDKLTKELDELDETKLKNNDSTTIVQRATLLLKRGRRYVYDRKYDEASHDFEEAYQLVGGGEEKQELQDAMEADSYARLLEWSGMARHWHYNLLGAMECYQKCADLEPTNALILVKQAGVQMDGGKNDEAMKLFDTALGLDPTSVDALLHRSNLYMLMKKPVEARRDLEKLLELRSNHIMGRLRLASILAAVEDIAGAKKQLDLAEQVAPNSSEVASYRGEILFTQGELEDARRQFERAIELEPTNPTPYVNAAMALLNTPPPPGQAPDARPVIRLLEQSVTVDPQFTAAYIHLGQLKLGTATDLTAAREVITLYDRALENCRSPEETRELCSMRTLALAQVEAAEMLGMETFNMQ